MEKIRIVCPHCGQANAIPYREEYTKANCGHCKRSLLETVPTPLDEAAFDTLVANSDIPVLVDFWAPWCGPCKMMAPAFEQAARPFALKVQFAKVDTEAQQRLAGRFGIRSIPTMILFHHNREIDRASGAMSAEQIQQWAARYCR